ncbi:DNA-methyltransferase [Plantactinospora sp. WMMB782]|uniref:DNA-methyltransferase n=1 Tax=Plantactinospora sp. WMMB782 TaxID=3404121 RepID=UPI003B93D948
MTTTVDDRSVAVTPYYQGKRATLYVGDCRDIAPHLPARSVDLMIADPPYGVQWRSGRRTERFDAMDGDDGTVDWPQILGGLVRTVLRNHRHVYVFGYAPDQVAAPLNLGGTAELIWDKEHIGPGNLELPWGPEHERFTFGIYEWSARNREKGSGRLAARLRQGSVVRAARPNSGQVRHPDEKPVPLLRPLVETSSLPGETVFDPTAGVCSTGVAAVLAGRRTVLIESDIRYADIGVERLQEAERLAERMEAA